MNDMIKKHIDLIDNKILSFVPETANEYGVIAEAMTYSLESGGKRIRPVLTLEFSRILGGDAEKTLPFAAAVEFIHTYSLIHDDLPCMDDDDLRRGKPSSHKKFGEATALLAGDALLTHAFGCLTRSSFKPEQMVKAVATLSDLAGANGMIGGQIVDMNGENKNLTVDELFLMDKLKTAALIKAACTLGCIAAERYDVMETASVYAENLGLAFQIVDDILDYLEGEDNSDIKSNKSTYVSLLGLEKAKETAAEYTDKAIEALKNMACDTSTIEELTLSLLSRNT